MRKVSCENALVKGWYAGNPITQTQTKNTKQVVNQT